MLTPGQTINICHILPTQFHFYCRFPCWFVPCRVLFVCLLVAYAVRQMHTLSQTASPRNNEALLCLVFFSPPILGHVHTGLEKTERDSGFVCVLHYGACAGVRWRGRGLRRTSERRGTQPELSESRGAQENTGPPKQNTFYGNGYIYLHGSQKNHGRMAF